MGSVTKTFDGETHVLVPRVPTEAMLRAGKGMMPVEYEFASTRERMFVTGFAPLSKQADVLAVWAAMLGAMNGQHN